MTTQPEPTDDPMAAALARLHAEHPDLPTDGGRVWEPVQDDGDVPLDNDGAEFVDGAEYRDRYGDTWRAVFDASEFRLVQKADGSLSEGMYGAKANGIPVHPWYDDAVSVVRSSGPMVPTVEDAS